MEETTRRTSLHTRLRAAIEELEAATRRVEDDAMGDPARLLPLMKQRSAAVQRLAGLLHEWDGPPAPALAERVRREIERGQALRERLLLLRAKQRAELTRLLSGQRAAAAVSTNRHRHAPRVNLRG